MRRPLVPDPPARVTFICFWRYSSHFAAGQPPSFSSAFVAFTDRLAVLPRTSKPSTASKVTSSPAAMAVVNCTVMLRMFLSVLEVTFNLGNRYSFPLRSAGPATMVSSAASSSTSAEGTAFSSVAQAGSQRGAVPTTAIVEAVAASAMARDPLTRFIPNTCRGFIAGLLSVVLK